eukprot:s1233_g17.t1
MEALCKAMEEAYDLCDLKEYVWDKEAIDFFNSYWFFSIAEPLGLGNVAHHSGLSHKEVRQRFAVGNAAFASHRRLLFQNPAFTATRRAELFQSLVISKIVYGMESWVFADRKTFHYAQSALLRLYRRLLKLPPDSHYTDDEVLGQAGLPSAEIMLRVARLRYLGLLYKCEHVTPWATLRADASWVALLRQDLAWLWHLVSGTSKLRDPELHFTDWEYVLRYHRSYWKTLLQRGLKLCILKLQDTLLLRKLHRDIFAHLEDTGAFATAPVRPVISSEQHETFFGCMFCQKRCRSKAGEGAHLFRTHGVVALERQWVSGSSCGIGSKVNEELRTRHDGLLPVQRASGPKVCDRPLRDIDLHHIPLYEALALNIYDFENDDVDALFSLLQRTIQTFYIGWTATQFTLRHLADSFTAEACTDVQFSHEEILQVLERLGTPSSWPFLCEIEYDTAHGAALYNLDLYESWCESLCAMEHPWTPHSSSCPRIFYKERIILHAYSGRRRPGDFQWFIDHLAQQRNLDGVLVVSLDLVINTHWGDIAKDETQRFWLHGIRSGWVLGMLSGPPCCTWSVARGRQDPSMAASARVGPRVIRTRESLWGLDSVSIREMLQLHDGHILLGFSLHAMALLSTTGGFGILEHPGEPAEENAASIWRLPLVQLLLSLPGFEHVNSSIVQTWVLPLVPITQRGEKELAQTRIPFACCRSVRRFCVQTEANPGVGWTPSTCCSLAKSPSEPRFATSRLLDSWQSSRTGKTGDLGTVSMMPDVLREPSAKTKKALTNTDIGEERSIKEQFERLKDEPSSMLGVETLVKLLFTYHPDLEFEDLQAMVNVLVLGTDSQITPEDDNRAPRRLRSHAASFSGDLLAVKLDFKAFRRLRCEQELHELPVSSKNVLRDIAKARAALRSEELHVQFTDEPVEEEKVYYVFSPRTSRLLELLPAMVIVVNSLSFAFQEENCFMVFYLMEALVKLRLMGCKGYFRGPEWAWNCFDMFCLSTSLLDFGVTQGVRAAGASQSVDLSILMLLKMLRLARLARLIRALRYPVFR